MRVVYWMVLKIRGKSRKKCCESRQSSSETNQKMISQIPKPNRDVLQQEAQRLIDGTGSTLGMMVGQATG